MTRSIFKCAIWMISATVIALLFTVPVALVLGWHFDVVPTGSMKPAIEPGGLVISRPVAASDVRLGDVILFKDASVDASICHRVIEIIEVDQDQLFRTQGDANQYPDADLVSSERLIGKKVVYVPHLGKVASLFKLHHEPVSFMGAQIPVYIIIIFVLGAAILCTELVTIWEWTFRRRAKIRSERLNKYRTRIRKRQSHGSVRRGFDLPKRYCGTICNYY